MSELHTKISSAEPDPTIEVEALRPHVYDQNIQEYDKRLPNWWLWTLYGAIIFAIAYWVAFDSFKMDRNPGVEVMREIKAAKLLAASQSAEVTDDSLWQMSRDPQTVEAGHATFLSTCAVCHQPDLSGKIGPSLIKETWIHGGDPMHILSTITNGVPVKGMPTWGPVLGQQKILEATAFILANQKVKPKPAAEPAQTGTPL